MQSSTPTLPSNNTLIKSNHKLCQNQQQPTRIPCKGCGNLSHEGKTMAKGVEVVKASLDLTGKNLNIDEGRLQHQEKQDKYTIDLR